MVNHIGGVGGAGGSVPANKLKSMYNLPGAARGADQVELSSGVREASPADVARMKKLEEIRRAVADGTYLTEEKLNLALNRAMDQVENERS